MSFNQEERETMDQIFKPTETNLENVREFLSAEIIDILKLKNNLTTIRDRVLLVKGTRYRPYDACTITKFLRPNFDCSKTLDSFVANLTPPFLIFIDFHFLFECSPDPSNDQKLHRLKFQSASKASAMNKTIKIANSRDYNKLLREFKNKTHADFLNAAFTNHCELYDYENSGLKPYRLLSLVVHVQKFPQA